MCGDDQDGGANQNPGEGSARRKWGDGKVARAGKRGGWWFCCAPGSGDSSASVGVGGGWGVTKVLWK